MDENALISASQSGDLDAFNRLVLLYQTRVFNLAYRIMGDFAAADDVTQEAFISAYRGIRGYRGGSFLSWLLRITTNACYDALRKEKRRPSDSLEDLTAEGELGLEKTQSDWGSNEPDPEREAERAELRRAIEECLRRLPTDFRVAVLLVDVEGYDYKEAAQIIRKPLGTVKSRVARARGRLRECLQRFQELLPSGFRLEDEMNGHA